VLCLLQGCALSACCRAGCLACRLQQQCVCRVACDVHCQVSCCISWKFCIHCNTPLL
jgi:hypothetical protein